MKTFIILIFFSILLSTTSSFAELDCNGKVTSSSGDVKITHPYDSSLITAEINFTYINPAIMGSHFEAKSTFRFHAPKTDMTYQTRVAVEKIRAKLSDPPGDCTVKLDYFPVFKEEQIISIRKREDDKLTFRCNFSLYANYWIKCPNDPIHKTITIAGGQPSGYLITDIKEGSTDTVCSDDRMNIGESKWCATIVIKSTDGEVQTTEEVDYGNKIGEGDVIETGEDGHIEIVFKDRSYIRIGPNSRVTISKLTCKNAQRDEYEFDLTFGRIWSKVSDVLGGSAKYNVRGNNSVCGVRGTEFIFETKTDSIDAKNENQHDLTNFELDKSCNCYTRTTSTLKVIDGAVEFSNRVKGSSEFDDELSELKKDIDEEINTVSEDEEEEQENLKTKEMLKNLSKNIVSSKQNNQGKQESKKIVVKKGEQSEIIQNLSPSNPSKLIEAKSSWYSDEKFKK